MLGFRYKKGRRNLGLTPPEEVYWKTPTGEEILVDFVYRSVEEMESHHGEPDSLICVGEVTEFSRVKPGKIIYDDENACIPGGVLLQYSRGKTRSV